ncbi:quinone oxidoreductase [Rhodoferax sp. GW822-FHT02A01]|uniref:quinone oxidoreductase family protein n=1 Tax=Rhodoferax sp. GW822-FHT02A01 TaxID=3141537 RepID=UPI00315CBA20
MDIRITVPQPGDATALQAVPHVPESPGPDAVRIRHLAIDVNFIDIYQRSGLYPLSAPHVPGVAAAGVIEAVGSGVDGLRVGEYVVYGGPPVGAYASTRLLPAHMAIPVPEGMPMTTAATSFFKALTAHMLLTRVFPVGPGRVLLVHAAAGGLGQVLVRWAKHLGAQVIGTTGSDAKAEIARSAGADHVIVGRDADVASAVATITAGRGVDYAIDGIGGQTLVRTLACVRKFGVVASIGQAGGAIPALPVEALGPTRSLSLARPSVMAYASDKTSYRVGAEAALHMIASGVATAHAERSFALADAASAHVLLESGQSAGGLLLIP